MQKWNEEQWLLEMSLAGNHTAARALEHLQQTRYAACALERGRDRQNVVESMRTYWPISLAVAYRRCQEATRIVG